MEAALLFALKTGGVLIVNDADRTLLLLPGRPGYRPLQPERKLLIQVRVSPMEKARLLELARQHGAETVSSFVRERMLTDPVPGA